MVDPGPSEVIKDKLIHCHVNKCNVNSETHPEYSFFYVPAYNKRRYKWMRIIGRQGLIPKCHSNTYYVCELHFMPEHIIVKQSVKYLKRGTIPTLHLPESTQIDKQVQTYNKYIKSRAIDCIDIDESGKTIRNSNGGTESKDFDEIPETRLQRSRYYTNGVYYETFILNLHYVSPKSYSIVEKTLSLPDVRTIAKEYVPVSTRVLDDILFAFKVKVCRMSEVEKVCAVLVSAVNLRENLYYDITNDRIVGFREVDGTQEPVPANIALVIAVRGIFLDWYQPLGYALLSDRKADYNVTSWIKKTLLTLKDMGLKVRVFASSVVTNTIYYSNERSSPYPLIIDNNRMYYTQDITHLIKVLYMFFKTNDIQFDESRVAKFKYVVQFYKLDVTKMVRLAPKLTYSHIYTANFDEMQLWHATQTLSMSVSAGLSKYIDAKLIEEDARHTVLFIYKINDLFDMLNSSTPFHKYEPKKAYCEDMSQVRFIEEMLIFFQNIGELNTFNGIKELVHAFQMTINTVSHFYKDIRNEGHTYLLTRSLNTDVMSGLTKRIMAVTSTKPTSKEFTTAFRREYYNELLKGPQQGNHADLTRLIFRSGLGRNKLPDKVEDLLEVKRADYSNFELPKHDTLINITTFLWNACRQKHKCKLLEKYVKKNSKFDDLVRLVENMEIVFRKTLQSSPLPFPTGLYIYRKVKCFEFKAPCRCFPTAYLQKLYIRMRLYHTVTINNRKLNSF